MKRALHAMADAIGLTPLVFRLHEWRRALHADRDTGPSPDGLPLPPAYLRMLVAGTPDAAWFARSGAHAAKVLADAAADAGKPLTDAQRILDFGCGAGRIARHIKSRSSAVLFGVDYNARLVRWCARHLPGTFTQNQLKPPLAFPDNHFDAIYAYSVFTHLRLATQTEWLSELARITAPNGVILLTFHDEDHPQAKANATVAGALQQTGFALLKGHMEGSNLMAAFQTRAAFADACARHFSVHAVMASTETGFSQALLVARK